MKEPIIIRSDRKYLTLIIDANGNLIARAPSKMKDKDIFEFIYKKQRWINKKLNEIPNRIEPLNLEKDKTISILGNNYNIIFTDYNKVHIDSENLYLNKINPTENLIKYLKNLAKAYITNRVEHFASLYSFKYNGIKISSARTNWGSCSYKNSLNFTYKLMLCPKMIVDYIVVHELCHTLIKNHSTKFYNLVSKIMPNYKECKIWLKNNASIINII